MRQPPFYVTNYTLFDHLRYKIGENVSRMKYCLMFEIHLERQNVSQTTAFKINETQNRRFCVSFTKTNKFEIQEIYFLIYIGISM